MTKRPNVKLKKLAAFVINSNGKIWFQVRLNPRGADAPRHYYDWMKALLASPKDVWAEVKPIWENGLYWLHSENMLLSALSDEDRLVRKRAIDQILKIRNDESFKALVKKDEVQLKKDKKCSYKKQRLFIKPTPNYKATNYLDMISWESQVNFEPPYTKDLSDSQVQAFLENSLDLNIPSHAVQTERVIWDVNQVAAKLISAEVRDGMIRSKITERKQKPSLKTKADIVR